MENKEKYSIRTVIYELKKVNGFQLPKRNFVYKYRILNDNVSANLKIGGREIPVNSHIDNFADITTIEKYGMKIKYNIKKKESKDCIICIKDILAHIKEIIPESPEQSQLLNVGSQIYQSQLQMLEIDKAIKKTQNIDDGIYTLFIEDLSLSFIGLPPRTVKVEETYLHMQEFEDEQQKQMKTVLDEKKRQAEYVKMVIESESRK